MKILVTGGAGYIGSHVVKQLIKKQHHVVIIDNLSRGHIEAVNKSAVFEKVDLLDFQGLSKTIERHAVDAVIHFAAFAYVGESVVNPLLYYQNNVIGSYNLLKALLGFGIKKIVFSSTCSIYGNDARIPINEGQPSAPINPYARTKLMIEEFLRDFDTAYSLKSVCLRYFNAAGASFDGEIGESHDPEPHLIPLALYTALRKRNQLNVFGNDYPTQDGTCIRDYIHVDDLADAHIKAVEYLFNGGVSTVINLGTGKGNSVMEIIEKAKKITGLEIPYVISPRRAGDPSELIADNEKARNILGWKPQYNIEDILQSAWNWHKKQGY